jgi:hypothetical protein
VLIPNYKQHAAVEQFVQKILGPGECARPIGPDGS